MTTSIHTHKFYLIIASLFLFIGCFKAPTHYYSLEYSSNQQNLESVEELEYDRVYRLGHPKVDELKYEQPKRTTRLRGRDGALQYEDMVRAAAKKHGVDFYLLLAVVQSESAGDPRAVSSANCLGLTQLAIPTARDYEPDVRREELFDPYTNLDIAGRHMRKLNRLVRKRFPNANLDERIVLNAAAWNAGWGRVLEYKGVPNFRETKQFTKRVTHYYHKYRWGKVS